MKYSRLFIAISCFLPIAVQAQTESLVSTESINSSVAQGEEKQYKISVLAGETVTAVLDGLDADADLRIKVDSEALVHSFDCKSINGGTQTDRCSLTLDNDADVYIGVQGYRAANYRLTANLDGFLLSSGRRFASHVGLNQEKQYKISALAGETVSAVLDGLSADADLRIKIDSEAHVYSFDCKSINGGTQTDSCSVTLTHDADVYVGVQGYRAADYRLMATAGSAKKYPVTTQLTGRPTDNNVVKPTVNNPSIDPVFNTRISMLDKSDSAFSNYPKIQSWNSDMSLLRVGSRLYNSTTLVETNITKNKSSTQAYDDLCARSSDYFRWSHKVSNRFFVINSSYKFIQAEINGNGVDCSNVLDDFAEYEVVHMGPHEGNIDNNDTYVVFVAKKPNDTTLYAVLYNIQTGSRVWTKTMPSQHWVWKTQNGSSFWAPSTLDWLSVSQSGKYIVFNNDNGNRDGMYRYDINFENKTKLQYRWDGNGQLYSEGGHGDLGYDVDGNEVFVQFISGVGVYSFNLDNPTEEGKELLGSPYGGGHISCRNIQRPGWCYVTANMDSNGYGLRTIFALKIDGTGAENVQNFSQTHINDGFGKTFGGASPDGTKVIFNSHWGTNSAETFIVEAE